MRVFGWFEVFFDKAIGRGQLLTADNPVQKEGLFYTAQDKN